MRVAAGTEPVRAVTEVLLVEGFQDHRHRSLGDFVFQRWDADAPAPAIALGDLHPTDRWRLISAGFQPLQQVCQIGLQIGLVGSRRLPVDPRSPVFSGAAIGLAQPSLVQHMGQGYEGSLRVGPSKPSYPPGFRGHEPRFLRTGHVSSRRFDHPDARFPEPGRRGSPSPASSVVSGASDSLLPVRRPPVVPRATVPPGCTSMAPTRRPRLSVATPFVRWCLTSVTIGTVHPPDGGSKASQVPGGPQCLRAPVSDPGGTALPGPFSAERCGLPVNEPRRLPRNTRFEARCRGPQARCLRLIPPITRRNPKRASGWRAHLGRAGLVTRWVPMHNFRVVHHSSHVPRLRLAHSVFSKKRVVGETGFAIGGESPASQLTTQTLKRHVCR